MGGGGGGGGTNNSTSENLAFENQAIACNISAGANTGAKCSSGAAGGGVAILRARTVTGTGIIDVRGAHAYNVGNDAGGGGGSAGAAILHVIEGGNATVNGAGGDGGNAWASNSGGANAVANRHGPGGGGGGAFVAFSPAALGITANLAGGAPGRTTNGPTDTYLANGYNGGLTTFLTPDVPGVIPGALCYPDLRLSKTNGTDVLLTSGTTTYTLTVTNAGAVPTSGTITVVDVLPVQLSVADGPLALGGAQAANWTCNSVSNVITCTSSTVIPATSTSVFAFSANISAANGASIVNRARVGGGGDPDNAPPTPGNTPACTADNVPAGCAIDADVTNAPFLTLSKSGSAFVAGNSGSYTLTVTNIGSQPSAGTIRVVDVLPAFVTFTSASSPSGFTCSSTPPNVVCNSSTVIPVGGTATITINVAVAAGASTAVTNRARVGGGGDPSKPTLPATDGSTTSTCPAPIPPATTISVPLTGCAAVTDPVRRVNLTLAKSDGQSFMPVNGQTNYQFTVSNTGDAASIGTIFFRDVLPAPMTWPATLTVGGPDAANWTCVRVDGTNVTCSSPASIPAGGSSTFSIIANVGAVATNGTNYVNKGRIAGGGDPYLISTPPTSGEVTACTGDNVAPGCAIDLNVGQTGPQIRLAKSHPDPQARNPGDTFAFNLLVSNSGGVASSGTITVVDVLPVGLTYSGPASFTSGGFTCSFNATPAPGYFTCTRATALAVGASTTISYNVTVSTPASNSIVNKAQVGGGGDPQNGTAPTRTSTLQCTEDGSPGLGCAIDPVPLNANPGISKLQCQGAACGTAIGNYTSSIAPVVTGTPVRFFLRLSNAGPSTVVNATISDTVPVNFTSLAIVAVTPSGGAVCSAANVALSASLLTGTIPSLPAGSTCDIVISGTASVEGIDVPNTATITAPTGIVDTVPGNNSSTVTTTIVGQDPALNTEKLLTSNADGDGSTTVTLGDVLTYTITVTNVGNIPLTNVVVTDSLITPTGGTTPCASVPVGGTCTLIGTYTVLLADVTAGSITNTGTGDSDETLPEDDVVITPVTRPDLSISKTDGGITAAPGETVTYTLSYDNVGTTAATGVVISETVPANSTFNPGASTAGWTCAPDNNAGSTCTLSIGTVAASTGSGVTFSVVVDVPFPSGINSISNTATIADDGSHGPDPTPFNNTGSDTTPVVGPLLTTTKVGVLDNTVVAPNNQSNVGDTIAYTVTVANSGNGDATGVTVSDPLPGLTLTCTIGGSPTALPTTLAAGESLVCTGTYTLVAGDISTGQVDNTATTTGTNVCDPTTLGSICSDNEITPLDRLPVLTTTKVGVLDNTVVAPNNQSNVGDTIAYTVTVANSGNGDATGVTVSDPLPGLTLTCTIGGSPTALPTTLAAGESLVCTGTYTLVAGDISTGQVSNTATTTGTNVCNPTTAGSVCSDDELTPLSPIVTLAKTLSVGGPTAESGETLTYSLTLTNATGTSANYAIADLGETVPANTTHAGGDDFTCAAATAGSACSNTAAITVPGNGSVTLSFNVLVDSPIPAGVTSILNVAVPPTGVPCDAVAGCDEDTPTPAVVTVAKLLTSEDGSLAGIAEANETLVYTITLTNSGGSAASYDLTDTLSAGLTYVTSNPLGANAGQTTTWTSLAVPAGGMLDVTVTATVDSPITVTEVSNLAKPTGDPDPACPSTTCVVTPTPNPNITASKS
ncbi:beta strand repeat-containing protein [Dokdonella sp.]|uniref:beta strand repeat-containing protein n=1 Tax=Dokdonella sp. TaxID=2291710 RepID=UPI0035282FED